RASAGARQSLARRFGLIQFSSHSGGTTSSPQSLAFKNCVCSPSNLPTPFLLFDWPHLANDRSPNGVLNSAPECRYSEIFLRSRLPTLSTDCRNTSTVAKPHTLLREGILLYLALNASTNALMFSGC